MARIIEIVAILGCHLKGILRIPLKFRKPIKAVNKKEERTKTPSHMINGLPKIKK
jgi:hypothetical protein